MKYSLDRRDRLAALRIVITYTFFAALWIYSSDLALNLFVHDPAIVVRFSVLKGFFFIIVTGAILYQLIASYIETSKRIGENLKESEERFRTMANSIPQLAWIAQPDGYVVWYNERWYNYTGTTPEQMRGWGWKQLHDPEVLSRVMKKWEDSIVTGNQFEMEFPLQGSDGQVRSFLTRVMPFEDSRGNVVQWFGTSTDITELKRAENALQERAAKLEELTGQLEAANKELESFSYYVSHDLREPLRAIDGFSRMLARDLRDKLDEESKRRLDVIREKAGKMDQLIEDVLFFSRMSRQEFSTTLVDVEKLVTEVWNELRENHPQRRFAINISRLPHCYADEQMIRQVFVNLLSNAIKFTKARETAEIEVGGDEKKDECLYYVKDNGAGFDMRFSGKLFRLFQRLHSEEEFEGTGVGLSIINRIIERHGGRIWAEGKADEGATFSFAPPKDPGRTAKSPLAHPSTTVPPTIS